MYKTPSQLPEAARAELVRTLNDRLADGLEYALSLVGRAIGPKEP